MPTYRQEHMNYMKNGASISMTSNIEILMYGGRVWLIAIKHWKHTMFLDKLHIISIQYVYSSRLIEENRIIG
jgi:hypothetical protein